MSSKVIINGLAGVSTKPKPIEVDKPFVIENKDNNKFIVFIAQTDTNVYQLMAIDSVKGRYSLNRMNENVINLVDPVKNGTIREYIEGELGYKVIDCDLELIINIS